MRIEQELADPNSCLNRAEPNEMVFVLLGRDVAAPAAVRAWIEERMLRQKNSFGDAQIQEAVRWVNMVEAEQNEKLHTKNHPG